MTLKTIGKSSLKWLFMTMCLATAVAGYASMNIPDDSSGSLTAMKVFAEVPLDVVDMLRPSTRLDMIDYYNQADSMLTVANALAGESRFVQVAPDYLKVSVTPVSTLEIKILKAGNKDVIMTLYTTGDPDKARDTEVRFFDSQLRPLDLDRLLKAPGLPDFFTLKGSGLDDDDLREKIPFTAVVYTTGPGDTPLTAALTTPGVISQEDRDLITPHLIPTLSAHWKGSFKFK